jgi:hypothetical protein
MCLMMIDLEWTEAVMMFLSAMEKRCLTKVEALPVLQSCLLQLQIVVRIWSDTALTAEPVQAPERMSRYRQSDYYNLWPAL